MLEAGEWRTKGVRFHLRCLLSPTKETFQRSRHLFLKAESEEQDSVFSFSAHFPQGPRTGKEKPLCSTPRIPYCELLRFCLVLVFLASPISPMFPVFLVSHVSLDCEYFLETKTDECFPNKLTLHPINKITPNPMFLSKIFSEMFTSSSSSIVQANQGFFLAAFHSGKVVNLDTKPISSLVTMEGVIPDSQRGKKTLEKLAFSTGVHSMDKGLAEKVRGEMREILKLEELNFLFRYRVQGVREVWMGDEYHFNVDTGKKNKTDRIRSDTLRNDDYRITAKEQKTLDFFLAWLMRLHPERIGKAPKSEGKEKKTKKTGEKEKPEPPQGLQEPPEKEKRKPRKRREKIPEATRVETWKNHCGSSMEGECFCCCDPISFYKQGWRCGHIVSDFDGGKPVAPNLRPVCASCNNDMDTENMFLWMERNHMKGLKNLKPSDIEKYKKGEGKSQAPGSPDPQSSTSPGASTHIPKEETTHSEKKSRAKLPSPREDRDTKGIKDQKHSRTPSGLESFFKMFSNLRIS